MLGIFAEKYEEAIVARGLDNRGIMVELLTKENGETWSLFLSSPNGVSCIVGAGEAWQMLEGFKLPDTGL